jgi:hypothetical protein
MQVKTKNPDVQLLLLLLPLVLLERLLLLFLLGRKQYGAE